MTKDNSPIPRDTFFDLIMRITVDNKFIDLKKKVRTVKKIYKRYKKDYPVYCGKTLISLILPIDFSHILENDGSDNEPCIKIKEGVMYEGILNKSGLNGRNSLIQILCKEYGNDICGEFIDNIQFLSNGWLEYHGFSIGLEDCMITNPQSVLKIKTNIEKCYMEAEAEERKTHNELIRKVKVNAALNRAKDIGMKIAKNSMKEDNNFLSTVRSGSKGDFFNIAQLTGLLGQQNISGGRVKYQLNNGTRSLVHYPFGKLPKKQEYESTGFIRHCFVKGLNPKEYFFHCMSGREGVTQTAMGTARSGYMQRRIIKLCEDIHITYDGTVRDQSGKVYQFIFGGNGYDPRKLIKVNKKPTFTNVEKITERLNIKYENKLINYKKYLINKIICDKIKNNRDSFNFKDLIIKLNKFSIKNLQLI